jgi:RimJ/RimL family protein N-acetyltransferase
MINLIYANAAHHFREHTRAIAHITAAALPAPLLHTARLQLRELAEADAPFMLQLLNEPSWLQFIGDRGVRTLAEARTYIITGPQQSYARDGFGFYLVADRENQASMGICGLVRRDFLEDVDIGFAFLPDFWGRGYAFEAAKAVLDFARDSLGLQRLVAITAPENEASSKLLHKLGLRIEGRITYPQDEVELLLWGIQLK